MTGSKFAQSSGSLYLSSSSSSWCATTTRTVVVITTTAIFAEVASARIIRSILVSAAATTHASTIGEIATVCIGAWAALLDNDLFTSDHIGIGRNHGFVCCDVLKFNESTILKSVSTGPCKVSMIVVALTFGRLTSK